MPDLKTVATIVEMVIALLVAMVLGDYLGYKFRAARVAFYLGIIILVIIVLFAIYAAIIAYS